MDNEHTRDPKVARERLLLALAEAMERVDLRAQEVRRELELGLSLAHPKVRGLAARLQAAMGEARMLELLTRPARTADHELSALTTRRGR